GAKIREAEMQKVPVMLVVGGKEEKDEAVSLRRHTLGDQGVVSLDECVEMLSSEAAERKPLPPAED
ncbi:MAG: His/Gly/Thr/Pro-type tRNA ligase C-terminal domain-containing protein, partial [Candidatus Sumerlaeota bacterium]